ncbi:MAG: hypothetical protein LBV02_03935 [Bacteroidales bacterium]|jgi:hypothetical protein|nr:hypothetical protein [Bacteroidales bacterium]
MRHFLKEYKYPFFLFIVTLIAYFGTLIQAPIYDFADEFFPGRHFMLEAIRNGIFPIWLPYQNLGTPIHGDPQSSTFYLPLYILSLFTGYTPVCWGIETIFHVFMGSLGIYWFCKQFTSLNAVAFMIASAYMMSGFFIGNLQHISWIIAGAWTPWIIRYMLAFFEKPSLRNALFLALYVSLLFTGGYTGFCFILFNLFLVVWIAKLILNLRKKDYAIIKNGLLFTLVAGGAILLLSLPSAISFVEAKLHTLRGEAMLYENACKGGLTFKCLLSFAFPLIANTENWFTGVDISLSSVYIGLLTLFPFIIGLREKKTILLKVFLYWCLFCFLVAFCNQLPFHKIAFHVIPFFKYIRLSSAFRLFGIIGILTVAALGLNRIWSDFEMYRKKIVVFLALSISFFVLLIITILLPDNSLLHGIFTMSRYKILTLPFLSKFLFEAILYVAILSILLFFMLFYKNIKARYLLIPALLGELIIHAILCIGSTGYITTYTNRELADFLSRRPQDYSIPHRITSSKMLYNPEENGYYWQNLGIYYKEIEWDSYNPYQLKRHEEMLRPYYQPEHRIELTLPYVLYFPNEIVYEESPVLFKLDTAYTHIKEEVVSYAGYKTPYHKISAFEPGKIVVTVVSSEPREMVVLQNNFKGWKAKTSSGKRLKVKTLNHSLIAVKVPAGEEEITLMYRRPELLISFMTSILCWILFGIYLLRTNPLKNK